MLPLPALPYVSPGLLSAFPRKLPGNVPSFSFLLVIFCNPAKRRPDRQSRFQIQCQLLQDFRIASTFLPLFLSTRSCRSLSWKKKTAAANNRAPPESSIQSPEYLLPRKFFCPQFLWAAGFFHFPDLPPAPAAVISDNLLFSLSCGVSFLFTTVTLTVVSLTNSRIVSPLSTIQAHPPARDVSVHSLQQLP